MNLLRRRLKPDTFSSPEPLPKGGIVVKADILIIMPLPAHTNLVEVLNRKKGRRGGKERATLKSFSCSH